MDVFRQRLEDEYDANVIVTAPTVPYKGNPLHRDCSGLGMMLIHLAVLYRDGRTVVVSNPTEFPDVTDTTTRVKEVQEPVVKASIIVPDGMSLSLR